MFVSLAASAGAYRDDYRSAAPGMLGFMYGIRAVKLGLRALLTLLDF